MARRAPCYSPPVPRPDEPNGAAGSAHPEQDPRPKPLAPTRELGGSADAPTGTWDGAPAGGDPKAGKPCSDGVDLRPGQEIQERYRIISLIGRGGMGAVYRAEDLRLHQEIALKFVHACDQTDTAVQSLLNEVRTARRVSHPHVCRVHDLGEFEGMPFVSMEYVDGEDLASLIRRIGRPAMEKCHDLARQICAGLHAAHQQGVLHRDLKPDNLMIDGRGNVRITDFGIAVPTEGDGHRRIAGTPAYMAPELFTGAHAKINTDIYSLGVVLYELYTGRSLNGDRSITELFRGQERSVLPPSLLVPGLDRSVERVILKCLDRDPDQRPGSALEVLAALPGGDALAESLAGGDTPSPELVAASGGSGLMPLSHALGVAVVVLAAFTLLVLMSGGVKLLTAVDLPNGPEVLRHKAEEHLESLGISTRRTTPDIWTASGYEVRKAMLREVVDGREVERHEPEPVWRDLYRQGRRGMIDFWYRQQPGDRPMLAEGVKGRVTYEDPPLIRPGMVNLRLDPAGRLSELMVVPPQTLSRLDGGRVDGSLGVGELAMGDAPAGAPEPTAMNWAPLLAAAGLDSRHLEPATPGLVPAHYADARAAWVGAYPERPEQQIRVEAAALGGVPIMLHVDELRGPLDVLEMPGAAKQGPSVASIALIVLIAGAVLMAMHSIHYRRGDLRGAVRFGLGMFVLVVGFTVLGGNHGGTWRGIGALLQKGLAHGIGVGVMLALFYFAFEPHIRRTWPQSMISWSRLLQARLRDPLVGHHVLLGLWIGLVVGFLHLLRWYVPIWCGGEVPAPLMMHPASIEAFSGVSGSLGGALEIAVDITRVSARVFATIALLKVLTRNAWVAALGTIVIWSLVDANRPIDPELSFLERNALLLIWLVHTGISAVVIIRAGILPCLVAMLVWGIVMSFPLQPDLGAWWVSGIVVPYGFVLLLLTYGVITATGKAPRVSLQAGSHASTGMPSPR